MLNATDSPQQAATTPAHLDTVPSAPPTIPDVANSDTAHDTPVTHQDPVISTISSQPAEKDDEAKTISDTATQPGLPPIRPPSAMGSAHPPSPVGNVKNDISDTTEKDSSYATALASKVGGSEPALMTFSPKTDTKTDVVSVAPTVSVMSGVTTSSSSSTTVGSSAKSSPPKPKGKFKAKLMGSIVAMMLLVAGLGAGYYLQTQQQDLEQQAYTPGATPSVIKDVLKVHHASESPSCPVLTNTSKVEACVQDLNSIRTQQANNNVVTYSASVGFENISDDTLEVVLSNHNFWCKDQPLGQLWNQPDNGGKCSIGCGDNSKVEDKTITIEKGKKIDVAVSRTADNGSACGSFQLDWFIKKITKGSTVVYDSGNSQPILASWGMCQTGATCPSPAKITGTVQCVDPADQKKYPLQEGTVQVGDKSFTITDGTYTADNIQAGSMISARLSLPEFFSVKVGDKTVTIQADATKTQAVNGCDATFMNANCSGINAERAVQCTNSKNVPGSYEWCTLPADSTTRSGFDFLVNNCVLPTSELACKSITVTPLIIEKGSTSSPVLNCTTTGEAVVYKVTRPSNTPTGAPTIDAVPPNLAYNLAIPANNLNVGTYPVSCVPCKDAAMTNCAPLIPACSTTLTVKAPVALACASTTLTPTTIVSGSANQMTLTCRPVVGAKSYKLVYPSNTASQTPITIIKTAPATGNIIQTFSLSVVPAGTYTASCVPCTNADGTGCIEATATACKASVTASKAVVGTASCESKSAYTLTGTTKTTIANGTATTAGGAVAKDQEFYYDITLKAVELTTGAITITDTLPAKLTLVSAKLNNEAAVTAPSSTSFFRTKSGNILTFVIPAFGSGATTAAPARQIITLKVKVNATATAGDVLNTASAVTAGSTNSTSSCPHKSVILPDGVAACVSKEMYLVNGTTVGALIADDGVVQSGSTVQYKVNYRSATITAGQVTITDVLPSSLDLVDKQGFDYNAATRTLSKTVAAFTGDQNLTARVKVKTGTDVNQITNTATVKTAGITANSVCEVSMTVPSYSCNTACTINEQCQGFNADYICSSSNNNRCRLKDNEASESCQPKTFACNSSCATDSECQSVNAGYSCISTTDGKRCRLTANQTATNCLTASATPTPTPTVGCNQKCTNNADCTNPDHICHDTGSGRVCRLANDVNSTTCSVSTTIAEAPQQPVAPQELPQSGPENWSNWLKSGLVVIGIGAMLLLLI